jgi:ABC-type sugar transport system permease subunit
VRQDSVLAVERSRSGLSKGEREGIGWRRRLSPIPFLAPALTFYVLFVVIPVAGTIALSFTRWNGFSYGDIQVVGFKNFSSLASDRVFVEAVAHNVFFMIGVVAGVTVGGLALALLLDRNPPLAKLLRGVYLTPTVISLVVIGVLFSMLLNPVFGVLDPVLSAVGLGRWAGDWLGDQSRVLPTMIAIQVWASFGVYMFLFIARLASVPQDLKDAAAVDGANEWQVVRHVTLPHIRSTISVVVLLASLESLRAFGLIYVVTGGGPSHATEVLSTWGYFQAFQASNVGYGSSIMSVLLMLSFAVAYLQVTRRRAIED